MGCLQIIFREFFVNSVPVVRYTGRLDYNITSKNTLSFFAHGCR